MIQKLIFRKLESFTKNLIGIFLMVVSHQPPELWKLGELTCKSLKKILKVESTLKV